MTRFWLRPLPALSVTVGLAALLCLAQVAGKAAWIAAALALMLGWMTFCACAGHALACLLFYLPWSQLMKLHPGGVSVYTLALIAAVVAAFVRAGFRLHAKCAALALLLLAWVLVGRLLRGSLPDRPFAAFFLLLLLFPGLVEVESGEAFRRLAVFFALGALTAALAARVLEGRANLTAYVGLTTMGQIVRRSGLFSDPNFYAAQITAALGGCFLLAERRAAYLPLCLGLIFAGLLAVSKMFMLVLAVQLALGLALARGRVRILYAALLAAAVVAAAFAVFSPVRAGMDRLGETADLSGFTTGRSDRWQAYALALLENPRLLLFGQGLAQDALLDLGSHNTPLQLLYQLGLPGSALLVAWLCCLPGPPARRGLPASGAIILAVGAFLPWLALDMLFFDELFLFPAFVRMGFASGDGTRT